MTIERSFNKDVRIYESGVEIIVPKQVVFEALGNNVTELVRIPKDDYPKNGRKDDVFIHYNLPLTPNDKNLNVALVRIVEPGFFVGPGEEQQPLLSLEHVWVAQTIDFKPHIEYKALKTDDFINVIGPIRNVASLQKEILLRYRMIRNDFSDTEKLALGVAKRKFKLIKEVSGRVSSKNS